MRIKRKPLHGIERHVVVACCSSSSVDPQSKIEGEAQGCSSLSFEQKDVMRSGAAEDYKKKRKLSV